MELSVRIIRNDKREDECHFNVDQRDAIRDCLITAHSFKIISYTIFNNKPL